MTMRANAFKPIGVLSEQSAAHFWSKVDERGTDECWNFKGQRKKTGYGAIRLEGRVMVAHRVAYTLAKGPIPEGYCVCHRCDNPPCCNPHHLFAGTVFENAMDRVSKGRTARLRGTSNGYAKLTDEQVESIRGDLRPHRVIAAEYGIGRQYVGFIQSGKRREYPSGVMNLHQHLLDMLGVDSHEAAGAEIARLHALDLAATPADAGVTPQPPAPARVEVDSLLAVALEANDLMRSAHAVAERVSTQYATVYAGTNFGALHECLNSALVRHHEVLRPFRLAALAPQADLAGGEVEWSHVPTSDVPEDAS